MNCRQGLSHNEISNFSEINSWKRFSGSAIILVPTVFWTEHMDAEGLGRKLLLTPSGDPRRTPEKQAVGSVTASHKMLTLQVLSSKLNAGTAGTAASIYTL